MNILKELQKWMNNNCIYITVELGEEFAFDFAQRTVYISKNIPWEEAKDAAQFLYEYGARLPVPRYAMAFIHEIGHYATLDLFTDEEVLTSQILAMFADNQIEYYDTPLEFSANMWAINFINTFPKKVKELVDIFRAF